jgi:acyl carrier protein
MELTIEKLQDIFRSAFSSEVEINLETTKDNLPEWDSINHLNLIVELEDSLNIQFQPDEIEKMKSVKVLLELIQKKSNA